MIILYLKATFEFYVEGKAFSVTWDNIAHSRLYVCRVYDGLSPIYSINVKVSPTKINSYHILKQYFKWIKK